MEVDEFEKKYEHAGTPEEFDQGEDVLMENDLHESFILLRKVKTLLDYIGNAELCKTLSKKERMTMLKVSGQIASYLDETAVNYEDEGEL